MYAFVDIRRHFGTRADIFGTLRTGRPRPPPTGKQAKSQSRKMAWLSLAFVGFPWLFRARDLGFCWLRPWLLRRAPWLFLAFRRRRCPTTHAQAGARFRAQSDADERFRSTMSKSDTQRAKPHAVHHGPRLEPCRASRTLQQHCQGRNCTALVYPQGSRFVLAASKALMQFHFGTKHEYERNDQKTIRRCPCERSLRRSRATIGEVWAAALAYLIAHRIRARARPGESVHRTYQGVGPQGGSRCFRASGTADPRRYHYFSRHPAKLAQVRLRSAR